MNKLWVISDRALFLLNFRRPLVYKDLNTWSMKHFGIISPSTCIFLLMI
jgi:hypothetical protein